MAEAKYSAPTVPKDFSIPAGGPGEGMTWDFIVHAEVESAEFAVDLALYLSEGLETAHVSDARIASERLGYVLRQLSGHIRTASAALRGEVLS